MESIATDFLDNINADTFVEDYKNGVYSEVSLIESL